ncbi:hypothetical protein RU639_013742 [Aspergillus parasiticus]
MPSLSFCLPIHPTEVLSLDEDTCSDLVNRFGRNLRQLLSLYVVQSSSVLEGARKGGHIRWHILTTQAGQSSNARDGCLKTYDVWVTIDQSVLGVVPHVLDDPELSKLGRALGDDFDDIRKLSWVQLVGVLQWLQEAKMIEGFRVQDNQTKAEVNTLGLLGNYNTDLSLCTPSTSNDPSLLTSDHALSNLENLHPHAVDELDQIWDQIIALPEDRNTTEFATPEHVATPMGAGTSRIFDALTYPTPPPSVNSPQYRSIATPLSIGSPCSSLVMTPTGPATPPGSDTETSCYPTPSTSYSQSPLAVESLTPLSPDIPRRRKSRCLELCRFGKDGTELLEQSKITQILEAEAGLLAQDPLRPLQPFLGLGEADTCSSLSALGLPVVWMGLKGAVNYYRLLEAVKGKKIVLCPFAKHIAQTLFYLNYKWLEKHMDQGRASVATLILNTCSEEPSKSRRDNVTGYHVRRGKICWTLAACLGAGILLHGGDAIRTIIKETFSVGQLNVFISFVLRTRPGSVHLFHSLEPVVKAIILGMPAGDLRPVVLADNNVLVRQEELRYAYAADQEALADQTTEETWLAMNAESIAKEKMPEFLPNF